MITTGEGSDHAQGAEEKNFHGGGGHAGMIPPARRPVPALRFPCPGRRAASTLPQTPTPGGAEGVHVPRMDNMPAHTVKVWTAAARFAR